MVHRRFCVTAQTSRRHFICYKLICSEITRKFSDPTKCHGAVNVVLTHILDPTLTSQRHWAGEDEEGYLPSTLSKTLILLQATKQMRWKFRVRMQIDLSTSCMCGSLYYFKTYFTWVSETCFINDTFFKVGDDVISFTYSSEFWYYLSYIIHVIIYPMRHFIFFHFYCIPNQQHISSSIFHRTKKKSF
jgi:hypothetical protein